MAGVARGRSLKGLYRREAVLTVAMVVALGIGLALRFYGLNWDSGFPYTPHPDERAILTKVAELSPPAPGDLSSLFDADESTWNPRWFAYGSLPLYALKGVELVYESASGNELTDLRLVGRAISALADVATVLMVYLLGSRLYGRKVGLLASGLLALSVLHIQLSHFFAVDTLLAMFTVVAVYFMYRVAKEGRLRDSVLAGAVVGLGVATKSSQAPIVLAFLMAHLLYLFWSTGADDASVPPRDQRLKRAIKGIVAGGAVGLLVLFITQPYMFLDWSRFFGDFTEQSEMVRRIRDYPYTRQYIDTTPYLYQMRQLATWGLGWPLGIVAWTGLAFVALRGMRLNIGLAYLVGGVGLPMALLLLSGDVKVVLLASAIAFIALLATLPFRRRDTRIEVLLLAWVVPYFLIVGAFQVKFLRYMIPLTPFLVLFGSQMLFSLWDRASGAWPAVRPALIAGLALIVGATAFYALSYTAVYSETHTAARASEWINRNAPGGSVILKEHWEEGLPNLSSYRIRELPMYDPDGPAKVDKLAKELARANYLTFFSNRLYGTLPRLPERYPISGAYYELLFTGRLGYELAHAEMSYPKLFGLSLVDDTFRRPGVPEPARLDVFRGSGAALRLGFSDESFTVYDHPKVLIFRNEGRYDADTIAKLISTSARVSGSSRPATSSQNQSLMLAPEDLEAQREGGTWTDIVDEDSWASRLPVLAWLLLVEGLALLALPLTMMIMKPLPDRGFLFSKALGLLLVALVVWLLASLQWMAFSRGSIMLAVVLLASASAIVLARRRGELVEFVKRHWRVLAVAEAVFLLGFLAFLALRMANPDLWHPFRGGEKPMDFAYLNAVLRSSYMPPYDPWFGGGYLNYYYWGQFMVATMIKATGIAPAVAYNLAVPTLFAMTVGGAYAVVYNLAEGTRRRLAALSPDLPKAAGGDGAEGDSGLPEASGRLRLSPVLAGIGGAAFVTILGNLDGAIQLGQGVVRTLFRNQAFGDFDFWRSSRMMAPDPPGFEITEFPYFTFLFADLHAHLMAMPFTLLVLGLGLAVVMGAADLKRGPGARDRDDRWDTAELARLAVLGIAVGALRVVNSWDYPTYLGVSLATILLASYVRQGGWGLGMLVDAALKGAFVFVVGYVLFLPFNLNYVTFFDSLERTTNPTVLWQFLAVSGLFVFILGSFFTDQISDWLRTGWRVFAGRVLLERESEVSAHDEVAGEVAVAGGAARLRWGRLAALAIGVATVGFAASVVVSGPVGSTVPFLAVMLLLVLVVGFRWMREWRADSPYLLFVAALVGVSLALAIGLDVFRVEGDIDRMNSVFKVYLQIWVMLGLASAYALWRLAHGRRTPLRKLSAPKKVWAGALLLLIAGASIYPVLGTQDRLRDRFNANVGLTLDGMAYMEEAVYRDPEGPIELSPDLLAIRWLNDNVRGSPVVLEGHTPTYRWGGRVSVYTGLPGVVGWKWHQEQQRWDSRIRIAHRIFELDEMYRTTDASKALALMRKHGVEYVYVGELERLYYPDEGIEKFGDSLGGALEKVYENSAVAIYLVPDG